MQSRLRLSEFFENVVRSFVFDWWVMDCGKRTGSECFGSIFCSVVVVTLNCPQYSFLSFPSLCSFITLEFFFLMKIVVGNILAVIFPPPLDLTSPPT